MTENGNGIKAAEFRGLMLERTEDILRRITEVEKKVACNVVDIATLKIKAGFWGFLAGAVPSLATVLILLLRDKQ